MANHPNRSRRPRPAKLELQEGQAVLVTFKDSDGAFLIEWRHNAIVASEQAGLPDDRGRGGEMYYSRIGKAPRELGKGMAPRR